MSLEERIIKREVETDYPTFDLNEIDPEARILAIAWGDKYFPGIALGEKMKLASDFMNYARRVQQRTPNILDLDYLGKILGEVLDDKIGFEDEKVQLNFILEIITAFKEKLKNKI